MRQRCNHRRLRTLACGFVALTTPSLALPQDERANYFDDPFIQVTAAIKECPTPEGPLITKAQMRTEAHLRTERGTRCFQSGQCRLPNSYLYDKEIIPRVKKAIEADGRFGDTSIWAEGRRRWVLLKGCVRTLAQSKQVENIVRRIDDVEVVINELAVRPRVPPAGSPAGARK